MGCAEIEGARATWMSRRAYREPARACYPGIPYYPMCSVKEIRPWHDLSLGTDLDSRGQYARLLHIFGE